jgi:hypothetical protein
MINAGQDSNIGVIKIQSLISLGIISIGTVGHLAFFADFIAVFKSQNPKVLQHYICLVTYTPLKLSITSNSLSFKTAKRITRVNENQSQDWNKI